PLGHSPASATATRATTLGGTPSLVGFPGYAGSTYHSDKRARHAESSLAHTVNGSPDPTGMYEPDPIPDRTAAEVAIYEALSAAGLKPQYEVPLALNGVSRHPRFQVYGAPQTCCWEHFPQGLPPSHEGRWARKLAWYRDGGVLPLDEGGGSGGTLVVTREGL